MTDIVPTVVPKVFDDVVQAKKRYSGIASTLHIDACDGIFAPNRTWLPLSGEKLSEEGGLQYEAHLMIDNPISIGVAFARAGASRIIGHIEAFNNAECAREAFAMWHKAGAREVGVAILLTTSLEDLVPYLSLSDFVHVMTISTIGEQGAAFDAHSLARIAEIHTRYPEVQISIDGGGNESNIAQLHDAGATRFCIGSALAKAKDPAKEFGRLMQASAH